MRLSKMLIGAVEEAGGRVFEGMQVTSADAEDGYLANLWTEAAGRRKSHPARQYVLATGGILGGGLRAGLDGEIRETALGLPVSPPLRRKDWFQREFLSSSGHPIFQAGITTDGEFQPVDASGNHIYDNLYIAGAALGGGDYIRERSLEGVSLVSGILIGKKIT
jgi:glycerol-3-phosphate dehydrogenase subunit B